MHEQMRSLTPEKRDELAAERLAGLLEQNDAAPLDWPCDTGEAVRAMQALGYRVDGDYVFHLLTQGAIPVGKIDGRHRWTPFDVFQLLAQLETRRRWTLHPMHVPKMSVLEKGALEAEAAGRPLFGDLDQFDVEQLLLMMEDAEQSIIRHNLRMALLQKLREAGAL